MPKVQPGEKLRQGKPLPEKTCDGCGESKSVTRFAKRGGHYKKYKPSDVRRYDNQCKRCRKPARPGQSRDEVEEPKTAAYKAGAKKGHRTRRQRNRASNRKYKQRVREETRIASMLYLAEQGCEECGERDPRKLEYDHKQPASKKRVIADLITGGYTWSSPVLRAEVAKCRVVCANCHRVHTVKQQGYYATNAIQETLGKLSARFRFDL